MPDRVTRLIKPRPVQVASACMGTEKKTGHKIKKQQGIDTPATSEVCREGQQAVLAEHSTDDRRAPRLRRWGTDAQGTHPREGEAGHHVLLN